MHPPVITVEHLSKAYRIGLKEEIPDTITEAALSWIKAPIKNWSRLRRLNTFGTEVGSQGSEVSSQPSEESGTSRPNGTPHLQATPTSQIPNPKSEDDILWALRDVSFDVREGEVVGIIGRNGAGKSTLLKILSRITEPTSGRIVIRGRVSSLLEVGTGFHPELTGRENIYMNGTILGMTKREIDRKFEEIVDFSGVSKFLDTPTKRYSSGMKVRLAFSVAAHLEPEILIVDEVLAVGDADFQKKCMGKMQQVASAGRTVLFVSHNLLSVQHLCSRALVLEDGRIATDGRAEHAVAYYMASPQRTHTTSDLHGVPRDQRLQSILQRVTVLDRSGKPAATVGSGEPITIRIDYAHTCPIRQPAFAIVWETGLGTPLFVLRTLYNHGPLDELPAIGTVYCHLEKLPLMPATYHLTLGCSSGNERIDHIERAIELEVTPRDYFGVGRLPTARGGSFLVDADWEFDGRGDRTERFGAAAIATS